MLWPRVLAFNNTPMRINQVFGICVYMGGKEIINKKKTKT